MIDIHLEIEKKQIDHFEKNQSRERERLDDSFIFLAAFRWQIAKPISKCNRDLFRLDFDYCSILTDFIELCLIMNESFVFVYLEKSSNGNHNDQQVNLIK
jgi:hypothetical protein